MTEDWQQANRAWWDEAAPLHTTGGFYDLKGFLAGRDDIRPFEPAELGSVDGLTLCHLQCHIGTDTLSWARRGARVTGLDFSGPAIEAARHLAVDAGLEADFVCADVYDARAALGGRTFDIVYTGIGALTWLPDLARWASLVADLLRPGGILYLVEVHPIVNGLDGDGKTIVEHTIAAPYRAWEDPEGTGTYAAPEAEMVNTITYYRNWALSEVVTAVLGAGLRLELLGEQEVTNVPLPWLVRSAGGLYRIKPGSPRYPLTYSLRARKSG